jgi:hypothetical protein
MQICAWKKVHHILNLVHIVDYEESLCFAFICALLPPWLASTGHYFLSHLMNEDCLILICFYLKVTATASFFTIVLKTSLEIYLLEFFCPLSCWRILCINDFKYCCRLENIKTLAPLHNSESSLISSALWWCLNPAVACTGIFQL